VWRDWRKNTKVEQSEKIFFLSTLLFSEIPKSKLDSLTYECFGMGNSCTRNSAPVVAFPGTQAHVPSLSGGRGLSLSSPALRKEEDTEKKRRTKAMHPGKRKPPCCIPTRTEHKPFCPRHLRYAAPPDFLKHIPTSSHSDPQHPPRATDPHSFCEMEDVKDERKEEGKLFCDGDMTDDEKKDVDELPTAWIDRPLSFREAEDEENVSRGRSYSDTQMLPLTCITCIGEEDEIMDPSIPVKVPMASPLLRRSTRVSRRKSIFLGSANANMRRPDREDLTENHENHEIPGQSGLSIDAEFVSEEEDDTECTTDEEDGDSSEDSHRSGSGSGSGSGSDRSDDRSDHGSSDVSSEASDVCAQMPTKEELEIEYPGVQPFPEDVFSDRKNASGRKHSRYEMIDGQYVEKCQPSPISEYASILKKSRERAKSHGEKSMRKKIGIAKEILLEVGAGNGEHDADFAEIPDYRRERRRLIGTRAATLARGVHTASDTQMERSKRASKDEAGTEGEKRKNSSSAPELKRRKSRKSLGSKSKMSNTSRVAFDRRAEQVRFSQAEAPSDIFKHKFTRRKTADAEYSRSYHSVLAMHAIMKRERECHHSSRRKFSSKKTLVN
jgi:hypothetical protein